MLSETEKVKKFFSYLLKEHNVYSESKPESEDAEERHFLYDLDIDGRKILNVIVR
jgi:hypothetical protein